jgi:uncharacterized SAM-binding protein YcdF (DUF218 family)
VKSLPAGELASPGQHSDDGDASDQSAKDRTVDNPELPSAPREARALGGLMVRRYRWGLSLKAKLLILVALLVLSLVALFGVYPFLALTERVDADVLVVEGWVHPYAIEASAEEFRVHHYRQIFTTGGPVVGKGGYINDYQTSASVGADLLKKAGFPAELVQMVPSHVIGRDRTYSSATALRDWFLEHNLQVRSVNIVTEGAHARRTRLLFEKALGPDIRVGVISVPSPDYDVSHWWYYSEGTEEIIQEGIGYLYAKLFWIRDRTARDAAGRPNR